MGEEITSQYDHLVRITDEILLRKDPYNHHGAKVAKMSLQIAARLGLDAKEQVLLSYAAHLHDVGKIFLEDVLLNYPRRLTVGEYERMKNHCQLGYDFLRALSCEPSICRAVYSHHEHYDGSGYPNGLKGESIPLFARIISIADMWDAITCSRAYRQAMKHEQALGEMKKSAKWFDPEIMDAFRGIMGENG